MAFFDQLKSRTQEMSSQLKTKAGQFKSKEFANGSMAMCALIAAADGSIDASERQKTAGLIMSNDVLAIFPPDELRQKFDFYCDKLSGDYDFGKPESACCKTWPGKATMQSTKSASIKALRISPSPD